MPPRDHSTKTDASCTNIRSTFVRQLGAPGTALTRVIHHLSERPRNLASGGARTRRIPVVWTPQVHRSARHGGGDRYTVGHPLVDDFLELAAARARPNTVRAYAHDMKAFFTEVNKKPTAVRPKDVLGSIAAQQHARRDAENVVRITDGGSGLSVAKVRRRLAAVSAFCGYLITRGDLGVEANPDPRGLPTRHRRHGAKGRPLLRSVRWLPRILEPEEVTALLWGGADPPGPGHDPGHGAGRAAPEVLGLRLEDPRLGEWQVFVAEGKAGHQRLVPMSRRSSPPRPPAMEAESLEMIGREVLPEFRERDEKATQEKAARLEPVID
jgi:hypothetical protein